MKSFLVLFLLGLPFLALAQAPDTLWTRFWPQYTQAVWVDVVQTPDSGFVLLGTHLTGVDTMSVWQNVLVVKTDTLGEIEWSFEHAGDFNNSMISRDLCVTAEGTILVAAIHSHLSGRANFLVLSLTQEGELEWANEYDVQWFDYANAIHPTADEGIIVAGHGTNDPYAHCGGAAYLLRLNAMGDSLWTAILEPRENCALSGVDALETADGNFLFTGRLYADELTPCNIYVGGITAAGEVLYVDARGNDDWDFPETMEPTPGGGAVICGVDGGETWLMRLDDAGELIWREYFDETAPGIANDVVWDCEVDADSNYIVAGYSVAPDENNPYFLFKVSQEGELLWRQYYSFGGHDQSVMGLCPTFDGGLALAVHSREGEFGYGVCGLARMAYPVDTTISRAPEPDAPRVWDLALESYPNPFNPTTEICYSLPRAARVTLAVYDVLGREVATLATGLQAAGTHTAAFDGAALSAGVYLCRLNADGQSAARKLLLLK